jgi:alkylated DNA repair dioxygenase AlkB
VSFGVQASLWSADPVPSDRAAANPFFQDLHHTERTSLSSTAWIDVQRGWMVGGFELLSELLATSDWKAERRQMYDNLVDVPRLLRMYRSGETVPWPEFVEARTALSDHYFAELGEGLTSTGMCLYRDGRDSVAWHGDTIGRGATHDTVVAILSLGASRTFALRPRGGGASLRFVLHHGDVIVMGGSCQRTWEHAIPKTTRNVGPRISIQFRPTGVS